MCYLILPFSTKKWRMDIMSESKFNPFDKKYVYAVQMPTGGSRKITREEFEKLSLNPPNPVPYIDGHVTIVHDYLGIFWSSLLTPVPFVLYFHIMRMAYGKKEYSFPSIPYLSMLTG